MQTFVDVHRWAHIKMVNYVVLPRENHAVVPWHANLWSLCDHNAIQLVANHAEARIALAEVCLELFFAHEGILRGPLCFVTIVPACCAVPVGDRRGVSREDRAFRRQVGPAKNFDISVIQQIARQGLGKVPFVGMVEAALFRRWGRNGPDRQDWVSWHCHLVVWCYSQAELLQILKPLADRHPSMKSDLPSVHVQKFEKDEIERKIAYMLKAPQKLYRFAEFEQDWTNPVTGEVKRAGLHLQKEWLKTGQRVRLMDLMSDRFLDRLIFGNAEGTELVREIRKAALTPFRRWEDHACRR